ncbi:SDR family NAD(P)-dependent oxidoreductase [Acidisoma sp. C75]
MATWFITGITRGLGQALAEAVLARGDTVIGTVRRGVPRFAAGAERLHVLTVDLATPGAAESAIRSAFDRAGRIDVIVNNAGFGLLGAAETASEEEMRQLFEVDVFAPISLIRAALPALRRQGSGHIVNITSIAGRAPTVGAALYSAAKYALEGFSAALALEAGPLGIKVTAVAPGAFRTEFLSPGSIRLSAKEDAAYAETIGRSAAAFSGMDGRQKGDPARAAAVIIAAVEAEKPPLHLLLGTDALDRARAKLEAVTREIDLWEDRTRSTDYPQA